MSLPAAEVQTSLFDVSMLIEHLFSESDRYRLFNQKMLPAVRAMREALCALYCETNGRPAIDPTIMAAVTLLQFMEHVPDRRAAKLVKLHLGWKFALGLEVDAPGFHYTSLCKFRGRLAEGGAERVGFDALLRALSEAGLVRKRGKQRLDSTHVLGAVAAMSRLEVVRETIRLLLVALKRKDAQRDLPGWEGLRQRYMDSEVAWHRLGKGALKEQARLAGEDAMNLIRWLRMQPADVRDHDQALLLERVFLEQYELEGAAPQRRKKEGSGGVKNPHDPDAQWAAKDQAKKKQWVGYKVQIAETVDADGIPKSKGVPTEQFITEVTTTEAIASDLDGRRRLETNQREHGLDVADELYVDAGYVTDDTLAEAHEQGRALLGPARPSVNTLDKKLYCSDDFDVNLEARRAVCPAGHESRQCSRLTSQATGQVSYRFEWAALCDACDLRTRCTANRSARRTLTVGEHHDHLQQRRRLMRTEPFQKQMHQRNGIEGTISEFARGGGRRTRYRGRLKTTLANYFQGAAVNANRWIRLMQWQMGDEEGKTAA